VGGATAINSDVERYATRDRNVIIPLVLLVVLLILGLLLRAVVAAFLLIGTVVLSFGAASGCRHCCSATCSVSRAPIPPCRCSCSCSWSPWASTTTSS
jgi:predicted RND superfamily exporter protein